MLTVRVRMRPEGEGMQHGVVVVAAGCLHIHGLMGRDLSSCSQQVDAS